MAELTGTITNISLDFKTQKPIISILVNEKQDAMNCYDTLHNEEKIDLKIDKHREKRSLNANNYAWKLLTEIANKLRTSKEEMYLLMLKRYGQSEIISVLSHIPLQGLIKYYEEYGESKLNGKDFKHYKVFKGSSEFDTREMSIFIDGIVGEAKELGIETKTPNEIAQLKSLWGSYEKQEK